VHVAAQLAMNWIAAIRTLEVNASKHLVCYFNSLWTVMEDVYIGIHVMDSTHLLTEEFIKTSQVNSVIAVGS